MDSFAIAQYFFNAAYIIVVATYIAMFVILFAQYKKYADGKLFRPYFRRSVMIEGVYWAFALATVGVLDFLSVGIGVRSSIALVGAVILAWILVGYCVYRTVRNANMGIHIQLRRFGVNARTTAPAAEEEALVEQVLVPQLQKLRVAGLDTDDTLVD